MLLATEGTEYTEIKFCLFCVNFFWFYSVLSVFSMAKKKSPPEFAAPEGFSFSDYCFLRAA